jgi:hypothetical protein
MSVYILSTSRCMYASARARKGRGRRAGGARGRRRRGRRRQGGRRAGTHLRQRSTPARPRSAEISLNFLSISLFSIPMPLYFTCISLLSLSLSISIFAAFLPSPSRRRRPTRIHRLRVAHLPGPRARPAASRYGTGRDHARQIAPDAELTLDLFFR